MELRLLMLFFDNSQAKAATGGRVRLMMNGGAALSRTTQEFLNTTLATALQGYG
jgi:long-chain acyl-CoA synthetase